MLFLYRPRQTWMPSTLPRQRAQQAAYNRHLQDQFGATRRVPPSVPAPADPAAPTPGGAASPLDRSVTERLKELAQLHAEGALSDAEFTAAKAKVLGPASADP
jgi:Short C-terminal domain